MADDGPGHPGRFHSAAAVPRRRNPAKAELPLQKWRRANVSLDYKGLLNPHFKEKDFRPVPYFDLRT
jgi:hypothetical protein